MRYQMMIAAGVLALMTFGASAQTAPRRTSAEPINSPFTYGALGATPSLQTKKRAKPAGEEKVAAEPVRGSKKTAPARVNESATSETSTHVQEK